MRIVRDDEVVFFWGKPVTLKYDEISFSGKPLYQIDVRMRADLLMKKQANIQLVVADIDGTFLDSSSRVSAGAEEAVREIRRRGIGFTFCSGRGNSGIKPFVKRLGLTLPYIVSTGAAIMDCDGETILRQDLLREEQIEGVVKLGVASGSDMLLHSAHHIFALASDPFWEDLQNWEWMYGYKLSQIFRVTHWRDALSKDIIRMDIFNQDDRLPGLKQAVSDLGVDLHATQMKHNLEIMDQKVDKGIALQHLADYLHIPMENILALGDGMNDASMLEAAGVGFAMHNSNTHVKNKANFVAPSNDQGGLAWVLNNLMSGKIVEYSTTE